MLNKTNLNEYPRCGEIWMCYLTSKDGSIQMNVLINVLEK